MEVAGMWVLYLQSELVLAGHTDLLCSSRGAQREALLQSSLSPGRSDGLLDGKEDGAAKEHRRLSYTLQ